MLGKLVWLDRHTVIMAMHIIDTSLLLNNHWTILYLNMWVSICLHWHQFSYDILFVRLMLQCTKVCRLVELISALHWSDCWFPIWATVKTMPSTGINSMVCNLHTYDTELSTLQIKTHRFKRIPQHVIFLSVIFMHFMALFTEIKLFSDDFKIWTVELVWRHCYTSHCLLYNHTGRLFWCSYCGRFHHHKGVANQVASAWRFFGAGFIRYHCFVFVEKYQLTTRTLLAVVVCASMRNSASQSIRILILNIQISRFARP